MATGRPTGPSSWAMPADHTKTAEAVIRLLPREAARPRPPRRPWGAIAMFLGPALCFYFAFIIYPVLVTFCNSVHVLRMDLGMVYEFVGLQHLREILFEDDAFWKAARNPV